MQANPIGLYLFHCVLFYVEAYIVACFIFTARVQPEDYSVQEIMGNGWYLVVIVVVDLHQAMFFKAMSFEYQWHLMTFVKAFGSKGAQKSLLYSSRTFQ